MKVLLVDDDVYVLNGLKNMISWGRLGIAQVFTAKDGEDAWEQYQSMKPDLLVTDVYMPRKNGLELIKDIRKVDAQLPVVILSGYGEFDYAKEAIHLNVAQYILKPAVFIEIENVLRDVLSKKDASDKKEQYFHGLQSHLEQSVPILREQFLFDMLTVGLKEHDISDKKNIFLQVERPVFEGGMVMSLLIHREGNKKTDLERDWQLYKFAAYNIAKEIVTAAGSGYVLRYMEDRLPILLFGDKEETYQKAQRIANELMENIGNYLELNTNIGLGEWYEKFTSYPISHKESRDVLAMVEYEGYQKVFNAAEIREFPHDIWPTFPLDEINQLTEALIQLDYDLVMNHWQQIEQKLLSGKGTLKFAKTLCASIINNIVLRTIQEDPASLEMIQLSQFLERIQSTQNTATLMLEIREILQRLHAILDQKYNMGKQHAYVQYLKKAIAEQYHHNISFSQLADDLHVTRNYLSSLFKRETGDGFSNYLTAYRIEKAKELMKPQRYMIYEISEMVGYSDPAYFSRVFKTTTGISPTDYALGNK
jgi:two-component system response regulator YesN